MTDMKCPTCNNNKLRYMGTMSTLMYCNSFIEDGVTHVHDVNKHEEYYACSNGHHLSRLVSNKCPSCDWKLERDETLRLLK